MRPHGRFRKAHLWRSTGRKVGGPPYGMWTPFLYACQRDGCDATEARVPPNDYETGCW